MLSLGREHPHQYSCGGIISALPSLNQIFADRREPHILTIKVESAALNSYFFSAEEIDLDLDVREIRGATEHVAVMVFLEKLAHATKKVVSIPKREIRSAGTCRFHRPGVGRRIAPSPKRRV